MFGKLGGRVTAHTAAALVATAALVAAASPAGAQVAIHPHQYFTGLVIGKKKLSQIVVLCAGPEKTGHPAAGQHRPGHPPVGRHVAGQPVAGDEAGPARHPAPRGHDHHWPGPS